MDLQNAATAATAAVSKPAKKWPTVQAGRAAPGVPVNAGQADKVFMVRYGAQSNGAREAAQVFAAHGITALRPAAAQTSASPTPAEAPAAPVNFLVEFQQKRAEKLAREAEAEAQAQAAAEAEAQARRAAVEASWARLTPEARALREAIPSQPECCDDYWVNTW